jgi:hypothetical protein
MAGIQGDLQLLAVTLELLIGAHHLLELRLQPGVEEELLLR